MIRDYVLTIVQLIGVVQCLFIASALLYLPGNRAQANRWLAALMLVWALMFAYQALRQNDLAYLAPLFTFMRLPLLFLYGPLLYLYLRQVTAPGGALQWRGTAKHLVVAAGVFLCYLPALTLDNNALLHAIYYPEWRVLSANAVKLTATQEWLLGLSRFVMQAFVLHLLVYLALCLRLHARHKRYVQEHFSALDKVSLDWMRTLLVALALLWLSVALSQLLFAGTALGRMINDMQHPVLVLFLSALGIHGLLQKSVPLPAMTEAPPADVVATGGRYQNSPLTQQQLQAEAARLQVYMRTDKPHLDSELTLVGLAARLELPARQLSQVINAGLGQNFLDFINGHRIEEAKALLADQARSRSVLTIAMDVGFNSKSAFYSAFKRHTGQTPSQFRTDCLASLPAPQA